MSVCLITINLIHVYVNLGSWRKLQQVETAYQNLQKFFRKLGCEGRLITTSACFIGPMKCVFSVYTVIFMSALNT